MTTMTTTISIRPYEDHHQPWFEKFNRAWIEKYFWMEPIDVEVLQHPDKHILNNGGEIVMAYAGDVVAGTAALKYSSPGVFEFTKMAVDEKFQGHGLGRALAEAAIVRAKQKGAHTIILYSHTSLQTAITLYRKLGFTEVPVDGPYKRSDIKMKLSLPADEVVIRTATAEDIPALCELGARTFMDTFLAHNTEEDMQLYVKEKFVPARLQHEMATEEGVVFFMATVQGIPAGYAKVRKGEELSQFAGRNTFEIERIYAAKEFIGKRVGQALLDTCVRHAQQQGASLVWLGVWEHNQRAIAFYEKNGFEKFGDHVFVLGNDPQTDWLMKKEI